MRTLTEIMNDAGTDKGTLVAEAHGYTRSYEQWFEPLRELPLRFLEIGICDPSFPGASLKAWYEYFPNATILGFDILPATRFDNDRITTFQGDQSVPADLARFVGTHGGDFDIIIDDGSHVSAHQQITLACLYDQVKPGGQYCIEDMQVSPNTVQLLLSMQRSIARRNRGKQGASPVALPAQPLLRTGEPSYLSIDAILNVFDATESLDLECDNKLARLVRR